LSKRAPDSRSAAVSAVGLLNSGTACAMATTILVQMTAAGSGRHHGALCFAARRRPENSAHRAQRLASFTDLGDIETTLEMLATRDDGPFCCQTTQDAGGSRSTLLPTPDRRAGYPGDEQELPPEAAPSAMAHGEGSASSAIVSRAH
jgi:hypothetical protein